jgi:hypothetical protein
MEKSARRWHGAIVATIDAAVIARKVPSERTFRAVLATEVDPRLGSTGPLAVITPLDAAVTLNHADPQQSLNQTLWRPDPVQDSLRLGQIDKTTGCRFDLPGGDRVS